MKHVESEHVARELKKGSMELMILSVLERRPRHGYEICKLIESRSGGGLRLNVASVYPLLYRLEKRGLPEGRWGAKAGLGRRRLLRLVAAWTRPAAGLRGDPLDRRRTDGG